MRLLAFCARISVSHVRLACSCPDNVRCAARRGEAGVRDVSGATENPARAVQVAGERDIALENCADRCSSGDGGPVSFRVLSIRSRRHLRAFFLVAGLFLVIAGLVSTHRQTAFFAVATVCFALTVISARNASETRQGGP